MGKIYDHDDNNFEVEELRMPQVLSLLEYLCPEVQYKVFESYTKTDRTNADIQKSGIDIIYKATPDDNYRCIDAKGFKNIDTFNSVLIELQAGYIHQYGLTEANKGDFIPANRVTNIRDGWYKFKPYEYGKASFTSPYQASIIEMAEHEGITFNKGRLEKAIKKYPWLLSNRGTHWTIDHGNDDDNFNSGNIIVKRNRLLYFNNRDHVSILKEMKAKKYHLFGDKWKQIKY